MFSAPKNTDNLDRSAVRRRELARRRGPARVAYYARQSNVRAYAYNIIHVYIAFSEQSWGGKAPPNVMLGTIAPLPPPAPPPLQLLL